MTRADARFTADPAGSVVEACHLPFEEAWKAVDESVGPTLTGAISAAIEAHRTAAERAGFGEPPSTDAHERSERLSAYGREVASKVLERLQTTLEVSAPSRAIGRLFTEAFGAAAAGCQTLPPSVVVAWTEGALASAPSDDAGRRIGKALASLFSSARHAGQGRALPLRALSVHHLRRELGPGQSRAVRLALLDWARWMGTLEVVFAEWADEAIPILLAEEGEDEDPEEVDSWRRVAEAGKKLEQRLEPLMSVPHQAAKGRAIEALKASRAALEADALVAGSFLLNPKETSAEQAKPTLESLVARRAVWDEQIVARLDLHTSLFAILSGATAVQARLQHRMMVACVEPTRGLPELADRLDAVAAGLESGTGPVDARLATAREKAMAIVAEAVETLPSPAAVEEMVDDGANATVEALQAMVRQVPATLTLHALGTNPAEAKGVETRVLPLQSLARQAFDALRMERIRAAATGVRETLTVVSEEGGKLEEVVAFGFEAASKEIGDAAEPANTAVPDATTPDAGVTAANLACEALRRAAETLRYLPGEFEAAIKETRSDVAEEVAEGCEALFERAGAGRMQAQLLAASSRFADMRVAVSESAGKAWVAVEGWARKGWQRLGVLWVAGASWLKSLFGEESATQAISSRTIRTLAQADVEKQEAPLVYQKLFSLDPISDSVLLTGREAQLSAVMAQWGRWRSGEGIPTLVVGRPGSGVTSFLNVLVERLGQSVKVAKFPFVRRVQSDRELSFILSDVFGLEPIESLDDLARAVLAADEGALPCAVALDGLELVYLRRPGGTDLLERLLTFMSETEARVFWIAGITTSAWQLVQKSEPTAVSQVDTVMLDPLTADELRQAVRARHGRSGLQVRFQEPEEGRRLLRRRLRRLRGTAAHHEVLEADFFERLHRASLGTVRLAMFLWLQYAEFDTADGVVTMQPMERPDFSLLDALDLTQNFTLKAFLEHGSLTLGEHDVVFRMPRHESYQIFESLGNRFLIEPIARRGGERRESEISEGLRYRVRPLLTGAVIAHLERRNIVH